METPPIYTDKTECQDCYKCVRECPVKAIKVEEGRAEIIADRCILCGHCTDVCPAGAKKTRDDLSRVKRLLASGKKVVASLAPSFTSEFFPASSAQVIRGLKELGFYGVSETALGAQEVSSHAARLLSESGNEIHLSSACPAAVDFIRKYLPEYAGFLNRFLSPVLSHCRLLKREFGESAAVVFIGPCIAKKKEADTHPFLLDAVLTFEDIARWCEEKGLVLDALETCAQDQFIPHRAKEGALYPIHGGMIAGMKDNCLVHDKFLSAYSGIKNVKDALADARQNVLSHPVFIELLACEGGCISGPKCGKKNGTMRKRQSVLEYAEYDAAPVPRRPSIDISEQIAPEPVPERCFSDEDVQAALKTIGKYTVKDELNCSGCGYDSCRDFAAALLSGKAEKTMCVSYMRKLAQNKANALMKTMPSGVVIVSDELKIIESNKHFAKLLGPEAEALYEARPGLEGACMKKITAFSHVFEHVLETGQDIVDKIIRLSDRVVRLSVFTIERGRIVGALLNDITEPSLRKEHVIKKTRQVVKKNLAIVQKIAYLLGENAAETEIILDSIVESFGAEPQNKGKTRDE